MRHVGRSHSRHFPVNHALGGRLLVFLLASLIASCSSSDAPVPTAPPVGNDASLASISLDGVELDPAFSSTVTRYTASVPNDTTSITVNATTSDGSASVSINGGTETAVSLVVGDNAIDVLVRAENGSTTRAYTIVITRAASDNANLTAVELTNVVLVPPFEPDQTSYSASVGLGVNATQLMATTEDETSTIVLNRVAVESGVVSEAIALNEGSNTITVEVTAEDGITTRAYTIFIIRSAFEEAKLSYLRVEENLGLNEQTLTLDTIPLELDPPFDAGHFEYDAMTRPDNWGLVVYATAENSDDTIEVNGIAVSSGSYSNNIPSEVGSNIITVNVTSEDASVTQSYTVSVNQIADPQAWGDFRVALSADGKTLAVGSLYNDGSGTAHVYARDNAGVWAQQADVKASTPEVSDWFGARVSLSADGMTLAAGAFGEDSATTGVNGNETDNSAENAGAAYVFERDSVGAWTQQAYTKASNTDADDRFGAAVALSGNGTTLAVGAPHEASAATGVNGNQTDNSAAYAGTVYVYTRDNGGQWSQQAYVKASNTDEGDVFGGSVALSADGKTMAVGASGEDSDATGVNGDQTDSSALGSGAVYIFHQEDVDSWVQRAYIKASNTDEGDGFGQSVALSADGTTLVVAAAKEASAATGVNGDQTDNSAVPGGSGALYVFTRASSGPWTQQAYIKASNTARGDSFAEWVRLSADGNTLAVSARQEDSAATGVNGDDADNSAAQSGAAYLFTRALGTTWSQAAYIKPFQSEPYLFFGSDIALSADGATLAVTTLGNDSVAPGLIGDQTDTTYPGSAVIYIFDLP